MKTNYLTFLTLILSMFSCNKEQNQKYTEDFFVKIQPEKISNTDYKTTVETNFPENTPFTITVSRDYKRKNNPEQYAGELFYSYNSFVKNGKINFDFKTDDQKWISEYEEIRKQNGSFDKSLTEIDKSKISDSIEISVLFTPKAELTDELKNIIGKNGENLKGKDVNKMQDFNVYEKKLKLYNKFNQ